MLVLRFLQLAGPSTASIQEYMMKFRNRYASAATVVALLLAGGAFAATGYDQHVAVPPAAATVSAMTAGEVRKVDADQGKVTIRHEPIKNLDMPAMTMVFRAEKPEQIKGLKDGDKVRFNAASVAGSLVVTHIEAAQ
jgi:Cu(I)/Ag(I) efflux system protein CusF